MGQTLGRLSEWGPWPQSPWRRLEIAGIFEVPHTCLEEHDRVPDFPLDMGPERR
jgi:hypothetical protein